MRVFRSLLCIALLFSASCAADDDAPSAAASSDRYPGPGSDIGYGLVVPEGTRLIGRPFKGPVGRQTGETTAVLEITGDPFAVWSDLVDQAAASFNAALPSTGICQWRSKDGAGDQQNIFQPRPPGAFAIDCDGFASGQLPDASGTLNTSLRLWWQETGSELSVTLRPEPAGTEPMPYPGFDPGAVPDGIGELLPAIKRDLPEDGEEFGQEENCFETGYTRFRVPPNTRFLGGGVPAMALVGVLEVEDPEAALRAFLDQLEGGDGPDEGEYKLTEHDSPEGSSWVLDGYIPAGGGSCVLWSTPDGRYVVVTAHSD